ncbi:hypothetical protein JNK13_07650 [bacterium]|nr:hypothetical protein [bacterium]
MKIKRIVTDNRKKIFLLDCANHRYSFPYAKLHLKPKVSDPIASVIIDSELGSEAFTYRLKSGREDSIHLDAVLEYNKDPEYLREQILYKLSLCAQRQLKKTQLTKREIVRRLKTSPTQLYRLLDQTFYGKTIDQMLRLLHVLGTSVDIVTKKAA